MDNGIKIVMSPVQLAAVMSDETVTEGQTFTNRICALSKDITDKRPYYILTSYPILD